MRLRGYIFFVFPLDFHRECGMRLRGGGFDREGGPTLDDWRGISLGTDTGPVNVAAGHGGVLGKADSPPGFPQSSPTPVTQQRPEGIRTITSTSVTSSAITNMTTDASGKEYVTSYGTAIGTRTSVLATTVDGDVMSTAKGTGTGGVKSLVPSLGAAVGEGVGTAGVVVMLGGLLGWGI